MADQLPRTRYFLCNEPVPTGFRSGVDLPIATLAPDWDKLDELEHIPFEIDPEASNKSLLAILHCHFIGELETVLSRLAALASVHAIYITATNSSLLREIHRLLGVYSLPHQDCQVIEVANRGRDVLPFWHALKRAGDEYDYFLKYHIKESRHLDSFFPQPCGRPAGDVWNEHLRSCLLPVDNADLAQLLKLMEDLQLAAMYPRPWPVLEEAGWTLPENLKNVSSILRQNNVNSSYLFLPLLYPVGNMFYGRVSAFKPFIPFFTEQLAYPEEPIPLDGTMLHAVERCYTFLLASNAENVSLISPPQTSIEVTQQQVRRNVAIFPFGKTIPITPSSESLQCRQQVDAADTYTQVATEWRERNDEFRHIQSVLQNYSSSRMLRFTTWLRKCLPFAS